MRTDRQLSSDNFLRHSKSINRFFLATASTNRPMFVNRNEILIKLKFSVQIAAEVLSSRFTKMNRLHRNNCPDFRTSLMNAANLSICAGADENNL